MLIDSVRYFRTLLVIGENRVSQEKPARGPFVSRHTLMQHRKRQFRG
jgi:hypothetical protein